MKYRHEVDGLRSVAVLPVLLFHGGFEIFSGGFVGVDVFFVISGYLITSIIIGELAEGRFSILRFYERRARRILPALFVVMAACMVPAMMWMLPGAFRDFSQSLIAVAFFSSNILFAQEQGYFSATSEEKPLLHTWSLAVEEQYYVIFPILLIVLWRFGRNPTLYVLAMLTFISFLLSEFPLLRNPNQHFFFSPARAWELLAGSFCAFALVDRPIRPNNLLSSLGLGLIVYSIFWFTGKTPFPSVYTLAPVLGTVLLILYCNRQTWVGKILSHRVPVGIGLISYSLYLWHQPLFAFARIRLELPPSQLLMSGLIAVTFVLAYLTWRFVELPVRRRTVAPKQISVFSGALTLMTVAMCIGTLGHMGVIESRWRIPPNFELTDRGERILGFKKVCDLAEDPALNGVKACIFGDKTAERTVILFGDSHAEALLGRTQDTFVDLGIRGIFAQAIDECEGQLLNFDTRLGNTELCHQNFERLTGLLQDQADALIFVNRWTHRLYPIPGVLEELVYTNDAGVTEEMFYREYFALDEEGQPSFGADAKRAATEMTVNGLLDTGKPVVLVYPIPETAWDIFKLNSYAYNVKGEVLDELTISAPRYLERNKLIIEWFDAMQAENLLKVSIFGLFCTDGPSGRCDVQRDGIPLYGDDDHLSYEGSKRVVSAILESLQTRLQLDPHIVD